MPHESVKQVISHLDIYAQNQSWNGYGEEFTQPLLIQLIWYVSNIDHGLVIN